MAFAKAFCQKDAVRIHFVMVFVKRPTVVAHDHDRRVIVCTVVAQHIQILAQHIHCAGHIVFIRGLIGAFNIFHVRAVLERIMCAFHMDIFKHFFLTKIRISTVFCAVCLIARV